MKETWKDVEGYEGLYQVSSLGRVKSLERVVMRKNGKKLPIPEKILKQRLGNNKYMLVNLSKKGVHKTKQVHQVVAMAFFEFIPNAHYIHVHHIDHDKTNNALSNLEITNAREHKSSHVDKAKTTSRYTGVYWNEQSKKWKAAIIFKDRNVHLGYFTVEYEAHLAYEKALSEVNAGVFKPPLIRIPSSKYKGVSWHKITQRWQAYLTINGKRKHIGLFNTEEQAHQAILNY